MTLVNDLIRQARAEPRPRELLVPANKLGGVAEHMRAMQRHPALVGEPALSIEDCKRLLLAGAVKISGIPLRVVGHVRA